MNPTVTEPNQPLLHADAVTVQFGGLKACAEVSVSVPAGQFVGLVGPNGAGKSTLFSVLSGLRRPKAGSVTFAGQDVTRMPSQRRARMGLARSFQQPELFDGLTVREHLTLAYRSFRRPSSLWADMFTFGALRRESVEERLRIDELIESLMLQKVADQYAERLPLGTSRLLEVARALATDPTVLLLDEPLSGLDAHEAAQLATTLRETCRDSGIAMLMVEHDVATVLDLCASIYVLDFGVLIASGTPAEIRADARVRSAYLGDDITASPTANFEGESDAHN